jgi:hypothetical protein
VRILLMVLSEGASPEGDLVLAGSFATAYYAFRDASIELVLASPSGGYLYLDNSSTSSPDDLAAARRFQADRLARDELADTICLDDVHAEDFDGAMCLGPATSDTPAQLPDRASYLISGFVALGRPVVAIPAIRVSFKGSDLLIASDHLNLPSLAAKALIDLLNGAPDRGGGQTC